MFDRFGGCKKLTTRGNRGCHSIIGRWGQALDGQRWRSAGQNLAASTPKCSPTSLKQEFQGQLDLSCWLRRLNAIEGRRTYVAVRQAEIRVIQDVEELRAELEFLGLPNRDVFERREVPIRISRPLRDVAAGRAKLLHWRVGVGSDSRK